MNLIFDIGNTRIKWGVPLSGDQWLSGCISERDDDSIVSLFEDIKGRLPSQVNQVIMSSVAIAPFESKFVDLCKKVLGVEASFVEVKRHFCGVTAAYEKLSNLGVDRWLAMLAAYLKCREAVCVIDLGTAITVDFVTDRGVHEGGLIMPGIETMVSALNVKTDAISVAGVGLPYPWEPGKDTAECVGNGLSVILLGMAKSIMEYTTRHAASIVVTGGAASLILPHLPGAIYDKHLVLKGASLFLSGDECHVV